MENKINDLKKQVGKPYVMFFPTGEYLGCFYPFYFVYENLSKYSYNEEEIRQSWIYGIRDIEKNFYSITREEAELGDMLVIQTPNGHELHVAMYIGNNKIIHVDIGQSMRINRADIYRNRPNRWYRYKGV